MHIENHNKIYLFTWLALLALLLVTLGTARINLGLFNTPVALLIAFSKMMLIILFFMHVRWSSKLVWLFAGAGFIWLLVMIVLTLSDYATRGGFTSGAS